MIIKVIVGMIFYSLFCPIKYLWFLKNWCTFIYQSQHINLMPEKSKDPFQFWEELKRRQVIRVMIVYVASAFAILEAADIIFPRIGFSDEAVNIVMYLLVAGFILSVILSWIYDVTPGGITG